MSKIFNFKTLNCYYFLQVTEKGFLKEGKKEKDAHSNLTNNSSSTELSQVNMIFLKYLLHVASKQMIGMQRAMISEREQPVLRTRH